MKPAAIYARVSSDRQKEEHTIGSQVLALMDYARNEAYRLLVSEKTWERVCADCSLGENFGGPVDEAGSDLCASVLGPAKRGAYDW